MPIPYDQAMSERVVVEVVAIEELPIGANASRRAVVRWSDGDVGEALRWFDDLCGYPHKSSYADSRVMPRTLPARRRAAGTGSICSA
jgi:hypothetical protein